MPSWLKKRFQVLKRDLINHVVVGKSQKNLPTNEIEKLYDNNNERITNNIKSPIQKIRNDLKAQQQRFRNKSDMNAYHDYAKWRDQVLISQNNCALRCIKEEKINNTDNRNAVVDSQCTATTVATTVNAIATNQSDCTSSHDNRQKYTNDKLVSGDGAADDANCDSESEFS